MFADRADAGRQLAERLTQYRDRHPLVLALPRGGVVVGAEIARALACDLEVMLVKKLRAPGNPELALGAVTADNHCFINEEVRRMTGADDDYLAAERNQRLAEMAKQHVYYRQVKLKIAANNRVVILVDDGLATGSTMIAASQAVALEKPAQVIVAVPVAPPDCVKDFSSFICLHTPAWFSGVGEFYDDFTQVSDEEVTAILKEFA